MKKRATFVLAVLLTAGLSFAQTGGDKKTGQDDRPTESNKTADTTGKKPTKTSKAHKGGKKSKKGSGNTSTPVPK